MAFCFLLGRMAHRLLEIEMEKQKYWYYCWDAEKWRAGEMVCCSCGKEITSGMYRYYECTKRDAYISQHQSCAEKTGAVGGFQKMIREHNAQESRHAEFIAACKEFAEKWGMHSADDFVL